MTRPDIDHTAIAFIGPDDGVIAHGFVLVIGGLVHGSQDVDRCFVGLLSELIPFVGNVHAWAGSHGVSRDDGDLPRRG